MTFRPCAVVPSHDHHAAVAGVVERLRTAGLTVFLVDDGSGEPTRGVLAALHAPAEGVILSRLPVNQGKGGAVLHGISQAAEAGFTHAIQVDADGQHDLAALPAFLAAGEAERDALVAGAPIYDASMPWARRIGRWATHFWVSVETLSRRVEAMCGFRLYPIGPVMALLREEPVGRGMDFDIDILVRLMWRGTPLRSVPVRVAYPEGNTSNFRMLRDNWRITRLHTRLVWAMAWRLPRILHRGGARPRHWSRMAERGASWGLAALAAIHRIAGRRGCLAAVLPVVLYFHLTGTEQRRASRTFLERAYAIRGRRPPGAFDGFRHTLEFAWKVVDTVGAWLGQLPPDMVEAANQAEIDRVAASGRGIVLIVSHLGNIDVTRAAMGDERRERITALVHTQHAENYMRLLRRIRPDAVANTIQVSELTPATMTELKDKIDDGKWVAIAGDRTPVSGAARVSRVPFLGRHAGFPQGPYLLAHLLQCEVYLMFCLREGRRYRVHFERFAERVDLPRRGRDAALGEWASRYARRLEAYCLRAPLQWYNFFDFWAETRSAGNAGAP